jgi:hypothetical protein
MRYYKRLQTSSKFKKDIIYTSEEIIDKLPAFCVNPVYDGNDFWQDALEIDYFLQVAKEKYKGDPVVICVYDGEKVQVDSNTIRNFKQDIEAKIIGVGARPVLYDGDTKQWAEIVEEKKTITDYENDTMMDKPMTHQEAIENLIVLRDFHTPKDMMYKALDLAIKNMEENKPKVLKKNEWAARNLVDSAINPRYIDFESIDNEYTQYLNDNK